MRKIVIKDIDRPDANDPESIIRWMCEAFGFSGEGSSIDFEILGTFASLSRTGSQAGISSADINIGPKVPRSTIIYHLNRFIEAGLVVKSGRKYYFRASELSKAIEEIEYDIEREMRRMLDMAREFDKMMGTTRHSVQTRKTIDLKAKDVKIE